MVAMRAYRCDRCDKLMTRDEVTRRLVRFDGPEFSGEYDEDLCAVCAKAEMPAPDVEVRPVRRRTRASA